MIELETDGIPNIENLLVTLENKAHDYLMAKGRFVKESMAYLLPDELDDAVHATPMVVLEDVT